MSEPVLSVRNLQVEFVTRRSTLRAIDGVSFDIAKGEVLGVVGESGAGKSVTGLAVIGLIDRPGRGWSDRDLAKFAGGNVLRVLGKAEAVSRSMADVPPAMDELPEAK